MQVLIFGELLKFGLMFVNQDKNMIDTTHFLIITTAIAPEGTAAYYLKSDTDKRNVENAKHAI